MVWLTRPCLVVVALLVASASCLTLTAVSGGPGAAATLSARPVTLIAAGAQHRVQAPLLAVVGASFTTGVGAGGSDVGWAHQLSHMLRWRLVISADSGAGYLRAGAWRRGPLSRLAARLDLARSHPAVLLIQGGHNDIGVPLELLGRGVYALVSAIRRATPTTRIGVITVFTTRGNHSKGARDTDRVIVAAARAADPQIMIFDPLAANWRFARIGDGLHPSPAGNHAIAMRIAQDLRADLRPTPRAQPAAARGVR